MSTNRSKDRSSLCSFTFADGRQCRTLECGGLVYPEPRRAAAFEAKAPAIPTSARSTPGCSGGSSDPPARGRERPFRQLCVRVRSQFRPRTPLLRCRRCSGGSSDPPARGREPPVSSEGSEGSAFRRCISAKPSCKPCTSPRTNISTPTAPIPGAKPSAPLMNSPPITWSLIPHRQRQSRPQPLVPQRRRTHPVPPISTQFVPH